MSSNINEFLHALITAGAPHCDPNDWRITVTYQDGKSECELNTPLQYECFVKQAEAKVNG